MLNNDKPETYVDKNVKVVIEPMINDMLEEQPNEPVKLITNIIRFYS